jgi:shikimate kinase
MGSGKSGIGRKLSKMLHFDFIDLDEMFEERYHISVYDFFEKYGEEYFRKIERKLLLETTEKDMTVISTGGGTPCYIDNMDIIKTAGISIYLRMTADELTRRLKNVKKKRPLLKEKDPAGLSGWVARHLEEREKYYLRADHIFYPHKDDLNQLVSKIM